MPEEKSVITPCRNVPQIYKIRFFFSRCLMLGAVMVRYFNLTFFSPRCFQAISKDIKRQIRFQRGRIYLILDTSFEEPQGE